jgi:DNA invertase Pin-like site-specific DNA recombinase
VSLHEGVDTSTPNGRLVFGIFASIAEFERSLIIDRTKSGMQAAKARGARIGRPRTHATADQVRALSQSGTSGRAIARELGVSETSVRRLLRSPAVAAPKRPAIPSL